MKKILALIAVLVVIALIGRLILGIGSSSDQQKEERPDQKAVSKESDIQSWSGRIVKPLNLEFSQRKATWSVAEVLFTGLNSAKSQVTVKITSQGRKAPSWLKALPAQVTGSTRSYGPKLTSRPVGQQVETVARYKNVPTNLLGPLCSGPGSWPSRSLVLEFVKVPGPSVGVSLSAPTLPAGRCLGAGRDAEPRAVVIRTKRLNGQRVAILGRVIDSKAQKVFLDVRGPAKKVRAKGAVRNQRFETRFQLPDGRYKVQVGLAPGQWTDRVQLRVR